MIANGDRATGREGPGGSTLWARVAPWLAVLAVVVVVRGAALENPWVWRAYTTKLDPDDIGWRQYSAIAQEAIFRGSAPDGIRFLAVGSSQTQAVYGPYAEDHDDFGVLDMAAMGPFDFVTYAERIERRRPEVVLLYLSDFDMARQPERSAIVLAPAQRLGLFGLARDLFRVRSAPDASALVAELAVGELLPEFKYRFVFRGILDKAIGRVARRFPDPTPSQPRVSMPERVALLEASFDSGALPFNVHFLGRFLDRMEAADIDVFIVEGRYNPVIDGEATRTRAAETRDRVEALVRAREGVVYLPRQLLPELTPDDYYDLTHVTPESAARLATGILELVERR